MIQRNCWSNGKGHVECTWGLREFKLVIERIDEGYLERFEERILGFGEVVVMESYISSHLFLVLNGRSVRFSRFLSLSPTCIASIHNWWRSRLISTLPGNQRYALQAFEPTWITSRQIKAGCRAMTRNVRRGGKIWVAIIKLGRILYEMSEVAKNIARMPISIAAHCNCRTANAEKLKYGVETI
ncbi:hypothetical protein Gotur_009946 [Gossypium turneri]